MQAMLFVMVERGMDNRVTRNKGKALAHQTNDDEDEAMWAVILAKEFWKKNVWYASLALIKSIIPTMKLGWTPRQLLLWPWDVLTQMPKCRVLPFTFLSVKMQTMPRTRMKISTFVINTSQFLRS